MKKKCPYCERPLRGLGLKCHACRRYVLGRSAFLLFSVAGLAFFILLLELFIGIF